MTIALIDLGSNSVRIEVVRIENNSYKSLLKLRKTVRLSENMTADMQLKAEPMRRTIEALTEFKQEAERLGAAKIRTVATAAVRKAENRQDFISAVKRDTGIELEILTGDREAYYEFLGVIGSTNIKDCLISDIGGGSCELIYSRSGELHRAISLPIGAVNLSERFFDGGEDTASRSSAKEYVLSQIKNIDWLPECNGLPIVALGGSARILGKANGNDNSAVTELSVTRAKELFKLIGEASVEERKNIRGMEPDRADIIGGGLLPLECLTEFIQPSSLLISDCSLRDGLIFEEVQKNSEKMEHN